jgi:hypothetical protein
MAEVLGLKEYFGAQIFSRWKWGENDCVFFAINWIVIHTGVDPAERLRGSYSDEGGAMAVIDREGGFVEMVKREMAAHSFAETDDPREG